MRARTLLALVLVVMAGVATAAADTMVLDDRGTLYRALVDEDGIAVTLRHADDTGATLLIPQTTGVDASNISIAVDSETGAVFTLWQEHLDARFSRIMLAAFVRGTWTGPILLAGDDGVRASSPVMLLHRARTTLDDATVISTPFLHLAWWRGELAPDGGIGMYGWVRLDSIGMPLLEDFVPEALRGTLPFGLKCGDIRDSTRALAHPKLFIDPQTGDPHVIFADIQECLFSIRRLWTELEGVDPDDDVVHDQRRRHVVVYRAGDKNLSIHQDLQLADASFEVGHNLSVVLYWDQERAVRYIRLDSDGWSPSRLLPLEDGLTHEAAVNLIRGVAR